MVLIITIGPISRSKLNAIDSKIRFDPSHWRCMRKILDYLEPKRGEKSTSVNEMVKWSTILSQEMVDGVRLKSVSATDVGETSPSMISHWTLLRLP